MTDRPSLCLVGRLRVIADNLKFLTESLIPGIPRDDCLGGEVVQAKFGCVDIVVR